MKEPVLVSAPQGAAVPVVFDSPHSGHAFPEGFAPAVEVDRLRGYEDRLVDDLVAGAPGHGIALVAARFSRAFVDPNRAPDDIEDALIEDWERERNPTDYARRGIGLVFRVLADGTPIYSSPLAAADVEARLAECWRPYHAALDAVLDDAEARAGRAWLVDWHSMRPEGDALAPDPGTTRPDFVVSDRDGATATPAFRNIVVEALRAQGHSVALNEPFKGGYIVARHGRPEAGRESLQVEINRRLYLDPDTLEAGPGFAALREALTEVAARIAAWARERSGSPAA
jgi:N-formylglutamate deformylase